MESMGSRSGAPTARAIACVMVVLVSLSGVRPSGASVPPAPATFADYFSQEWDDPMDFSNAQDFDTTPGVMMQNAFASMSSGLLNVVSARPDSFVYLLKRVGGSWPTSTTRDSGLHPLDTNTYSQVQFRMHSVNSGTAAVSFQTCDDNIASCTGIRYFDIFQGWHTYHLDMRAPLSAGNTTWSGFVRSVIFTPSVGQNYLGDVTFDWFRIYQPRVAPANTPPVPQVIDPDEAGGEDWATTVRGDAWNFNEPSDVMIANNMNLSFSNGELHGASSGNKRDPLLIMNTNGLNIDAATYHKASVKIRYDGPWGLQDVGGGMVSRFIWQQAGNPAYQITNDLVMTTAQREYFVELKTDPPSALLEPESSPSPVGWGGAVSLFRFDPHEDHGDRTWHIDEIRLARNDRVNPRFDIRFQDWAWEPGTTGEVFADTDLSPGNGITRVGSVSVGPGENRFSWDGGGVGPGSYWIYVALRDPSGNVAGTYSTGQLDVAGAPGTDPFGSFDVANGGVGAIEVGGWAIDADVAAPIDVHVYVASSGFSQGFNLGPAGINRPDLLRFGKGADHGFGGVLTGIPEGDHFVCAYGVNVGGGANTLLGCRVVRIPSNSPSGAIDVLGSSAPGAVRAAGWTIDPNGGPNEVHLYVGALGFNLGPAAGRREDLAFFGSGVDHGFDTTVPVPPGTHQACAYAANVGPGGNTLLGCRTVVVK